MGSGWENEHKKTLGRRRDASGWYFLLNESSTVHIANKAQLNLYYEC